MTGASHEPSKAKMPSSVSGRSPLPASKPTVGRLVAGSTEIVGRRAASDRRRVMTPDSCPSAWTTAWASRWDRSDTDLIAIRSA